MATMKAVRIHRFGGVEELQLEDLPLPEPAEDEILVKVLAASLNPVDCKIREGRYPPIGEQQLPLVAGRDLCGVVQACGAAVNPPQAGEEIYAFLGEDRGSHAEYAIVKTGEYASKPTVLDAAHAAAVPLAALTAWQGLFEHGGLKPGQRVLIHGGAGGVGHFAVQFAKAAGAEVFTTVSADDLDFVGALGADDAIDYRSERFEELVGDLDLVLDLVAGETQQRSFGVLKQGGTLISTLTQPSAEEAAKRNLRAERYTVRPNGAQLSQITQLIESGTIRPMVDRVFALSDVRGAHHRQQHDHFRGKLVLEPAR